MSAPKDKAKELYNFYLQQVKGGNLNETYHNKAKECVYKVIKEMFAINMGELPFTWYWEEVRKETEKISI